MIDLENLNSALFAVALLAPGYLISFFRNNFVTRRHPKLADSVFQLTVISAVYYSSVGLALGMLNLLNSIGYFCLLFVLPVLIGVSWGVLHKRGCIDKALELVGLNPVHPATTAWDYMFGTMRDPKWIIVCMKDGREIWGWFDRKSSVSSDLDRRDIFLADMRREGFSKVEPDGRLRGVWINASEVETIEIVADKTEETKSCLTRKKTKR